MVMEPSAAAHGPFPASLPPPALRHRDRRMYDSINDMPAQGTTGQLSHTEESYLDTATWIHSTHSQDSRSVVGFPPFQDSSPSLLSRATRTKQFYPCLILLVYPHSRSNGEGRYGCLWQPGSWSRWHGWAHEQYVQ